MALPSSWPQTDDSLVSTWTYLRLIPRCLSPSVFVKHVPPYIYGPCTHPYRYITRSLRALPGLIVLAQLHLLPTPPVGPGAPFQPTWGSSVPAPAGMLFCSPLSGSATQKNLEFSRYIINLLGGPSGPHLLLLLSGAPGWPLALTLHLPCLRMSMILLLVPAIAHPMGLPPWRAHSL